MPDWCLLKDMRLKFFNTWNGMTLQICEATAQEDWFCIYFFVGMVRMEQVTLTGKEGLENARRRSWEEGQESKEDRR